MITSSRHLYKNLDLISDLQSRGINVEFVLTLKPEDSEEKVLKGRKISGILNVGPVPPEECLSLYQECDALFLPTLAECFSASYPEAMKMEKPIVTTDLGFARSICGNAALYFQMMDPVSAADQIEKLVNNPTLRKKLIQYGKDQLKTFDTPEERARKYLSLCEKLVEEKMAVPNNTD